MYFGNTIDNLLHRVVSQPVNRILYNPHNNCIDNFWRYVFDDYRFFIPSIFNKNVLVDIDDSIPLNANQLNQHYNLILINSLEQYKALVSINSLMILSIESPRSEILNTSLPQRYINVCYDNDTLQSLNKISQNNILIPPCLPDAIRGLALNNNVYQNKITDLSIIVGNIDYDTIVQTVGMIKNQINNISIEIINNFETEYLHQALSQSKAVFWMEEFCDFNTIYSAAHGCRIITTHKNESYKDINISVVENIGDLITNIQNYDGTNLENDTSSFRNSLYLNNNFNLIKRDILNIMEKVI